MRDDTGEYGRTTDEARALAGAVIVDAERLPNGLLRYTLDLVDGRRLVGTVTPEEERVSHFAGIPTLYDVEKVER